MKKNKLKQQMSSVLLCILVLMQGCQVYKQATLNDGVESGKPVRMTYLGQPMEFEKVITRDGNYYGIQERDGELKEMVINEEFCQKVKVEKVSTFLTIAIPVVATGAAIGIMALVNSMDFGWGSE